MKLINIILSIILLLFAAVQYNDPDFLIWGTIYTITALVVGFAAFGKQHKIIVQLLLFGGVLGLLYLLPEFITTIQNYNPNQPNDVTITHTANIQTEIFKEFFGLLICVGILGFQYWQIRRM